jgi:hypothetical protein
MNHITNQNVFENIAENIPDIYNLNKFDDFQNQIEIKIIISHKIVQNIYINDIKLNYSDTYYDSEYILIETLIKHLIYNKTKKYLYLFHPVSVYFCTNSPHAILIDIPDVSLKTISNNSVIDDIFIDELNIYLNLPNFKTDEEYYVNIYIKAFDSLNKKIIYGGEINIKKFYLYQKNDKYIEFFNNRTREFPVYYLITTIKNKINNNFDESNNIISKISTLTIPLYFENEQGEIIFNLYKNNNKFRLYLSKINMPDFEQIHYLKKCKKCCKKKTNINIFSELNSICDHLIDDISTTIYHKYKKNKKIKIYIKTKDLIDSLKDYIDIEILDDFRMIEYGFDIPNYIYY